MTTEYSSVEMSDVEDVLDLAHQNLHEIPDDVLENRNLRMLYLEDNRIAKVPEELFLHLENLVWLDLRKNRLKTLPGNIANHNLETLLLQDNLIESLPKEIGLLPNLKVLQLSGNPISYPNKKILEGGTQAIIDYLKTDYEYQKEQEEKQSREIEEMNETPKSNLQQACKDIAPLVTFKPSPMHMLSSATKRSKKIPKMYTRLHIYKIKPHYNSGKYVSMEQSKGHDLRIRQKTVKGLWMNKLQEITNEQQAVIQRIKNTEALKDWRQTFKGNKTEPDYRLDYPYDVDFKIPSKSSSSKMVYHPKNKNLSIEKLIIEIVHSLQALELERQSQKTPKSQMEHANREIKRILELQKRISALKIKNCI